MPSTPGWRRHVPLVAYALALAVLILALAKPQRTVAVPVERASIMLTIDFSGSMQATDVPPSRLVAARAAAESLPQRGPGGRPRRPRRVQPVRAPDREPDDRPRARCATRSSTLQPSGGTATGEALAVSLACARARRRTPTACACRRRSSCCRTESPFADDRPQEIAQRAKDLKIPIYTVTLGTPTGTIQVPRPNGTVATRPVPPDPVESREVAEISGGRAYTADTAQNLSDVYKALGSRIGYRDEKREITAAFSGGALALLAGGALLSLLWFRRLV